MQLVQLLKRELKVVFKRMPEVFNIIMLFIIVSFAFSFALGPNLPESMILQIATAVIIVCFMLSSNLSSHFILEKDIESGMLQQLFIRVNSLNSLVFAKIIAQFLCFGMPLAVAVPVVSVFFNLSPHNILVLMGLVVVTAFLLAVINVMIAGITSGIRSGAIISIILCLPLYVPLIIMDLSYIDNSLTGESDFLMFLESALGYAFIMLPLSIFSIRQTIRNTVEF